MRPKTTNMHNPVFLEGNSTFLKNPGPGSYENTPGINKDGKYNYSKY